MCWRIGKSKSVAVAIRTEATKVGGTLHTGKGVKETSEVLDLFDTLIWVWFYKYTHIGKDTEGMYILLYIGINTSEKCFYLFNMFWGNKIFKRKIFGAQQGESDVLHVSSNFSSI